MSTMFALLFIYYCLAACYYVFVFLYYGCMIDVFNVFLMYCCSMIAILLICYCCSMAVLFLYGCCTIA